MSLHLWISDYFGSNNLLRLGLLQLAGPGEFLRSKQLFLTNVNISVLLITVKVDF